MQGSHGRKRRSGWATSIAAGVLAIVLGGIAWSLVEGARVRAYVAERLGVDAGAVVPRLALARPTYKLFVRAAADGTVLSITADVGEPT